MLFVVRCLAFSFVVVVFDLMVVVCCVSLCVLVLFGVVCWLLFVLNRLSCFVYCLWSVCG